MFPTTTFARTSFCSARSRDIAPMSDEQIRRFAPSVFADAPHSSRSQRYAYIPTHQVLTGLRAEGFEVFSATQARSRLADRQDFTKHLLRLRHVGDAGRALDVGDSVAEICLLNSHDGSSAYQLFAGLFRLVCRNGLMVADSTLGGVKVQHSGKAREQVIAGAFEILDGCTRVVESREAMRAVPLSAPEQHAFARAALRVRFDAGANDGADKPSPITTEQALSPRRFEDRAGDLWTTFNRVQENLVRGGVSARSANGQRRTTREVRGIDQSVTLNRALWTLAEEMRNLKTQ